MRCFRATLSDRRELSTTSGWARGRRSSDPATSKAPSCSPRRYCQRRLANPTLDLDEWAKKYTPEMYHLAPSHDRNCEDFEFQQSSSPNTLIYPLALDIHKRCKSAPPKPFLSVSNINLPSDIKGFVPSTTLKNFSKYKSLPKHEKGNLHRMFVKTTQYLDQYDFERSISRTSSYEEFQFENYLRLISPDELRSCYSPWLFDLQFHDDNDFGDTTNGNSNNCISNHSIDFTDSDGNVKKTECSETCKSYNNDDTDKAERQYCKMKGKRRSITLSRPPSPETIQVIRVDVVSNYSSDIESDGAIVSGTLECDKTDENISTPISQYKSVITNDSNSIKKTNITKRCKKIMLKDTLKTSTSISTPRDDDFSLQCKKYVFIERPQTSSTLREITMDKI